MKIWSRGFLALWVGLAVAGGLLVSFLPAPRGVFFSILCINSVCSGPTAEQILKAERPPLASVLLEIGLLAVCLAGVWLVSVRLLRVAFGLLAAAIAVSLLIWLPSFPFVSSYGAIVLFLVPTLLLFSRSFLTLGGLLVLSFGIARRKAPGYVALVGVQAFLALSVGVLVGFLVVHRPRGVVFQPLEAVTIGSNVATICGCFVLAFLLFTWGAWKQRPLVMGFLVAGLLAALFDTLVALLYDYGVLLQLYKWLGLSPFSVVGQLPPLFLLLSLLVLIQTERVHQKTGQASGAGVAPVLPV